MRLGILAAALGAVAGIGLLTGADVSAEGIRRRGEDLGALGPVLFIPLAVALNCLFVPFPALAGAAGLLFGTALGTALSIPTVAIAAVVQLLVGRYAAGGRAGALIPPRARRFDDFLERRGFFAVLYLRLVPGLPFIVLNYAAGLTRLRAWHMGVGTGLAKAPRVWAYAALGGSLGDLGAPEARIAVGLLVLMAVLGAVLARRELASERSRAPLSEPRPGPA